MVSEKVTQDGPVGVGGWLAFRIVQLAILNPLWALIFHPAINHPYLLASSLTILFIGFTSAILLVLEQPVALRVVAAHLFLWMAYAIFLVCRDVHSRELKHLGFVLILIAFDFATYFAWFLYFCKSVRVRNTFGRNL
jgi:hypothetical protein